MRYLMTYTHSHTGGSSGFGNADVTTSARPTLKNVRGLEAAIRRTHGDACINVVLLNLIPLAEEDDA